MCLFSFWLLYLADPDFVMDRSLTRFTSAQLVFIFCCRLRPWTELRRLGVVASPMNLIFQEEDTPNDPGLATHAVVAENNQLSSGQNWGVKWGKMRWEDPAEVFFSYGAEVSSTIKRVHRIGNDFSYCTMEVQYGKLTRCKHTWNSMFLELHGGCWLIIHIKIVTSKVEKKKHLENIVYHLFKATVGDFRGKVDGN